MALEKRPKQTTALFALIRNRGFRQRDVAAACGIEGSRFNRILSGRLKIRPDEKRRVSQHLGVEESELWDVYSHLGEEDANIARLKDWLATPNGMLCIKLLREGLACP